MEENLLLLEILGHEVLQAFFWEGAYVASLAEVSAVGNLFAWHLVTFPLGGLGTQLSHPWGCWSFGTGCDFSCILRASNVPQNLGMG